MRSVIRLLLTVSMNLLLVVAALLIARLVIGFFGQLDANVWAVRIIDLTDPFAPSLGLGSIVSPYRGTFDFNAAAALVVVLGTEWLVALVRRFVR